MKSRRNSNNAIHGSVLIVALVITVIATIGVMSAAFLIAARGDLAEAELTGLDRRVRERNSRSLAREVFYQKHLFTNTLQTQSVTYSLGEWGDVEVGPVSAPALSFSDAARIHPTGASPERAFAQDVSVNIQNGSGFKPVQYQLRSYNPILAGDLLSMHPTDETGNETVRVVGDLKVRGRAVFWPSPSYLTSTTSPVRAESYVLPATLPPQLPFENPDGAAILPANYVAFPQTLGLTSANSPYSGYLDIVNNPTSDLNSYFKRLTDLENEATVSGFAVSTDGVGPSTTAAGPIDAALLTAIADPAITDSALVGQLAASAPLSSALINALLLRLPAVSDAYMIPLLNSQAPLPDDVLTFAILNRTAISSNLMWNILANTSFSYISDGHGTLVINLSSSFLTNVIATNFDEIILRGQYTTDDADAAKLEQPRAIAVNNAPNIKVARVSLDGITNQRRFVLALSQTGVLDAADLTDAMGTPLGADNLTHFVFTSATPYVEWRMIAELEGVSSLWDLSAVSTATMKGGIRTDYSVRIPTGTLFLERENETEAFETILSRNAWIETYR